MALGHDPAKYRAFLHEQLAHERVPEHLREGLTEYLVEGRPMGRFLTAVVENDLYEAYRRGDPASLEGLPRIMSFLIWHAPSSAWGSPAKVEAWLDSQPERRLELYE